jgi:hypothetical protein
LLAAAACLPAPCSLDCLMWFPYSRSCHRLAASLSGIWSYIVSCFFEVGTLFRSPASSAPLPPLFRPLPPSSALFRPLPPSSALFRPLPPLSSAVSETYVTIQIIHCKYGPETQLSTQQITFTLQSIPIVYRSYCCGHILLLPLWFPLLPIEISNTPPTANSIPDPLFMSRDQGPETGR